MKPSKEGRNQTRIQKGTKVSVVIEIDAESYYKLRGLLFSKGIAFNELINYLNLLFLGGNEKAKEVIEEAIKFKLENLDSDNKIAKELNKNKKLIYRILNDLSALNKKEKE